jgi:hypothetical protein
MNFGHATLPSSGVVTGLVPAVAMAKSHEEWFGVGVTGTTLIACRGRKIGNVVRGPCISAVLSFRYGRCELTAKNSSEETIMGM